MLCESVPSPLYLKTEFGTLLLATMTWFWLESYTPVLYCEFTPQHHTNHPKIEESRWECKLEEKYKESKQEKKRGGKLIGRKNEEKIETKIKILRSEM